MRGKKTGRICANCGKRIYKSSSITWDEYAYKCTKAREWYCSWHCLRSREHIIEQVVTARKQELSRRAKERYRLDMIKKTATPIALVVKAKRLLAEGMSKLEVAEATGIGKSTVYKIASGGYDERIRIEAPDEWSDMISEEAHDAMSKKEEAMEMQELIGQEEEDTSSSAAEMPVPRGTPLRIKTNDDDANAIEVERLITYRTRHLSVAFDGGYAEVTFDVTALDPEHPSKTIPIRAAKLQSIATELMAVINEAKRFA